MAVPMCPRRPAPRLAGLLAAVSAATGAVATTYDFDVTCIERTPRYNYDATKNNPAPGDLVTFTGHIRNWGDTAGASVAYRWQLDGVTVATGTLANFAAGQERTVTWQWNWQTGSHYIKLTADPSSQFTELSEQNNERTDRTDSLIVGFWVEQSVYTYFQQHQRELPGIGSNSWDDWAQRQIAKWNTMCAEAVWPISPQGVLDRFRLDKIVIVADGALPLHGGLPTNNPDLSDKTVDLMWGFPRTLLDGTFYTNHTSLTLDNAFYIETSLLHELGHARYLIDCYGFDTHNTAHSGGHDSVQIWEGPTYVGGSSYMPYLAWGEVLYYNTSGGVMTGPYGFRWSPYEAGALNRIAGQRARCGNYNAPCNIGEYLQDLPGHNHMRFTDRYGRPRRAADIRVYRAVGDGQNWYGKTFDNTPDLLFTADGDGYVDFGRNPFAAGPIVHTYGTANGVMILRIAHQGQIWYRFVEVSDFNQQYWQGNTQDAYYTLSVAGNEKPPGDLNCDGRVDFSDINPFVMALVSRADYEAAYPACAWLNGDINGDGAVDFDDINPFVACLVAGGCP